jgi:hypothetical protein
MTAHRNDSNTGRLLELSDQVSRIANTLARLSTATELSESEAESAVVPAISAKVVATVIRARRLRGNYFDDSLFADPAWDMMLDLFHAELTQRRVAVSSLCIASSVPATTALRWSKAMTDKGLFVRRADPFDARRVYVELSPQTSHALHSYFARITDAATT